MKKVCLLFMAILFLSACGWTKEKLGMARSTPDDGFKTRKERLVIPPDYSIHP